MLGTDVNHDGIFEKEDAFLGYCRDNHITLILLLDLRYLIGRNVMIWDENRGREIDAEEHLCRFMNKAREEFCIDQIAATAGSENGFNRVFDFQQNFLHPTPPIIIPLAERTSSLFDSTLLIIEDSNLVQGTPEYYNAEELKFYYRATHFGDIQPNERRLCHSYFNYLNIEYEFWRSTLDGFMPAGTTIDPTCNDYCCTEVFSEDAGCSNPPGSPCSNGTAFPRGEDARFFLHFLPTLRAMRSLADNYNTLHGFAETDNEYMRTQAYTDPYYRIGNTFMQDYASLLDGSGGIPPTGTTCIGGNAFPRLLDRICPYSYHRYPYANIDAGLDGDWQWLLEHLNGAQLPYGTTDNNTDIHTIFSAEKISNYSYDNYWGPWFDETSSQNIFEAEKIYYRKWYLERYTWIPVMSEPRENAIHPGGIIWYTQSQMNGVLDNPKIFIADDPGCTSGNADINFQYIGPCEAGIQIEFRILRSGLNVWPTTGWNVTSTFTPALGVWNPTDVTTPNAAPDITALAIPSLMNDYSDPYTVQMRLTYAGGCSYLYEEDLFLNSGPAITAIGQSEFCEGGSVELHAPTGNSYRWMKDGNTISGATSQNYLATTSGLYSCEITGGSCSGVSGNSIPVTVHPNPYVDILIDCSVSPAILYVGPVLNTTPSSIGPGGVTYLWNTGSTLDQITTSIDGGYFLTVTTPTGCTREIRRNYDSDGDNPVLSLGFYRPPSADCSSDGSQEIIINSPGGVVHASYTDGIGTYWLNWTAGLQHTISNLSAGHYTVFVSVQGTCVESLSFDIGIPPTLTFNALPTDPSCHNGVNGTIELSISGAIGLYRIQVPTILFDEYHSLPYTIPGFSAGNYFIRISDGSCNWGTQMVSVGNPLSMNLTMSSSDATGCFNSETGSASVSVAGGSSPYQYLWNTIPAQTSLSIANLGFGTYEVRVTDNNGCTSTASTQVSSPNDIILDPIQPSNLTSDCGCTGLATFFVDGDFPPFSVSAPWVLSGSNATLSNACPGQYTIIVTDDNNCTTEDQVTITGTGSAINLQTTQQDVTCFGMQDGEGSVSVTSGGTGTFTYLWDDPNATTTATISGLAAGIYNVTVTDASGCVATGSITISQPASALIASSTQGTSIACNGGSTTVTVSATGGTAPYSGTGTFTVAAGTYSYTVTDDNGCSLTTSITVNEPSALAASSSATTILCNGGSSTVTVTATGGTAPYTGTGSFTVTAGTYTYPVSDANGCSTSTTITVSEPTLLVASATVIQLGCTGGYSTVQVTASGGTGSYTGVGNFSVLAGTYPYTVSDGNGCQSPTSVTVTDDINCCYVPSGEIVGSQVTIIPSGYYFGIKSLDHDVEIHSNVHFANLDLTISSSRKITVQSTGVLTISTNSYLHACANMWNGIINNGGTIIIQDSRIEDALEAVLMNKGNLQLDNGTFDHNFIGIHFLTGAYDQSTTWIRSSTFDCTTGQISKLPHVGELTSSHIVVENVSGLVMGTGIGQGFLNNIRNAKIGLNIVSSDIEVYNNNFEVLPYTFNYPIKCTAISASGTSGNFCNRLGSDLLLCLIIIQYQTGE
ncbi:MAG: hypothetical protein IPF75_00115 [Bacteroidetes bacterium]|nr:hypothetical protein [Bacteroidota bacterium]